MGVKNYLVEGVSCSGKTSVATELQRQGYHMSFMATGNSPIKVTLRPAYLWRGGRVARGPRMSLLLTVITSGVPRE